MNPIADADKHVDREKDLQLRVGDGELRIEDAGRRQSRDRHVEEIHRTPASAERNGDRANQMRVSPAEKILPFR